MHSGDNSEGQVGAGFLGDMGFATEDAPTLAPAADTGVDPDRRRRIRTIVASAVAGAVILPSVIFGPTACQVLRQQGTTLKTPPQLAGLSRDDSESAKDTSDYLLTAVSTQVPLDKSVGAIYVGTDGISRGAIIVGGTGVLWSPDKYVAKVFALITDKQGGVEAIHDEPAGPLGGTMKCGTTVEENTPLSVCAWADHGSLAVGLFANRGVAESAGLFRDMRAGMEHR